MALYTHNTDVHNLDITDLRDIAQIYNRNFSMIETDNLFEKQFILLNILYYTKQCSRGSNNCIILVI